MNEMAKRSDSVVYTSYKAHKISHFSKYFLLTYTSAIAINKLS